MTPHRRLATLKIDIHRSQFLRIPNSGYVEQGPDLDRVQIEDVEPAELLGCCRARAARDVRLTTPHTHAHTRGHVLQWRSGDVLPFRR